VRRLLVPTAPVAVDVAAVDDEFAEAAVDVNSCDDETDADADAGTEAALCFVLVAVVVVVVVIVLALAILPRLPCVVRLLAEDGLPPFVWRCGDDGVDFVDVDADSAAFLGSMT
jgi:hypothetical protein